MDALAHVDLRGPHISVATVSTRSRHSLPHGPCSPRLSSTHRRRNCPPRGCWDRLESSGANSTHRGIKPELRAPYRHKPCATTSFSSLLRNREERALGTCVVEQRMELISVATPCQGIGMESRMWSSDIASARPYHRASKALPPQSQRGRESLAAAIINLACSSPSCPRSCAWVLVTPRLIPGSTVLTPGSSLGSYIVPTDQQETFVRTLSSFMHTRENFLVDHPSQIAPKQARLTWRFFRDRLLKKKMHLVGMDTLLILLSLGPGNHHPTGQDITIHPFRRPTSSSVNPNPGTSPLSNVCV
jgi:hypothetical protein